MELKDFEYNFIDNLYDYDGLWDRKAKCGLKVIKHTTQDIVIATDIYKGNPGGSVTEYCAELAMIICKEYDIDIHKLLFIHHTPEVDSSHEFFEELFYKVDFSIENNTLKNPDWNKLERSEVVELTK